MKKAILAGTYDPPTVGHAWMIQQGSVLFDELYIGIGENPAKKPWFNFDQRREMLDDTILKMNLSNTCVVPYQRKLLVNFAKELGCSYILRGIRNQEDFNFETGIKAINERIDPDIITVYLSPPKYLSDVASSTVKGLIGFDGWETVAKDYVSDLVMQRLIEYSSANIS